MPVCIICGEEGMKLSTCRDLESWRALHDASSHSEIDTIQSISSRDHFPTIAVHYHHNCRSRILLRNRRANYQARIWRLSTLPSPNVPSPDTHGWSFDENGDIIIKWLGTKPAPEEILELLSCLCKRSCTLEKCCCMKAGLKCTDLCSIECDNMANCDDNSVFTVDEEENYSSDLEEN